MNKNKIIAVTGGIGAGKSVVCKILSALGYPIYDCDTRAKQLMDTDVTIKEKLKELISPSSVNDNGDIDRKEISKIVFSDSSKLEILNSIVHGEVRNDIYQWTRNTKGLSFIETAIVYQSGIDKIVDEIWEVTAPVDIRVQRVCLRNHISPEEVSKRIESQTISIKNPHPRTRIIINDNLASVLKQITNLIKSTKY